jgi:hypothetical protein
MAGASVELGLGELEDVQVAPLICCPRSCCHPSKMEKREEEGQREMQTPGALGRARRRYNVDACVREGRSLLGGYVCCRWPPSRPTPTG